MSDYYFYDPFYDPCPDCGEPLCEDDPCPHCSYCLCCCCECDL